MSRYRRGAHTIFEIKYNLVRTGEVQVPSTDEGGGPSGSRAGSSEVSRFGRSNREGIRQQGSCSHSCRVLRPSVPLD